MKRFGWISVIAVFLALSAFAFGMISRQTREVPAAPSAAASRPSDTEASTSSTEVARTAALAM